MALMATVLAVACSGCPKQEQRSEPVVTTKPAPVPATEPVEVPPSPPPVEQQPPKPPEPEPKPPPPDKPNWVEVKVRTPFERQTGWLKIEELRDDASIARAVGWYPPKDNRIVIQTEGVQQFAIDLGSLGPDWERRVILRIDGRSSELTRKKSRVVHLRRSPAGAWEVVEEP